MKKDYVHQFSNVNVDFHSDSEWISFYLSFFANILMRFMNHFYRSTKNVHIHRKFLSDGKIQHCTVFYVICRTENLAGFGEKISNFTDAMVGKLWFLWRKKSLKLYENEFKKIIQIFNKISGVFFSFQNFFQIFFKLTP